MFEAFKPKSFRIFDEGVDVETLYGAVYWWVDKDGRTWIRLKGTNKVHEVLGEHIEMKFE